jgi:hypothetical protein
MRAKPAVALLAAAAVLGVSPCHSAPSGTPDGVVHGTFGGENAALLADDTSAHVHIGCTYGQVHQALVPDAFGYFDVPGEHNITAHPVDLGIMHPARFSGRMVGGRIRFIHADGHRGHAWSGGRGVRQGASDGSVSDLPAGHGSLMGRIPRALAGVVALVLAAGCNDPLPSEVEWLAGRWRWTGSCCTIAGTATTPSSPDALVIELHHNGEVDIAEQGGEPVRTRFDVDVGEGATRIRFGQPIFQAPVFLVTRTAADRIVLKEYPTRCVDCPDAHAFVRTH